MQLIHALLVPAVAAAATVPYQEYILAPASRTVIPTSVHSTNGSVTSPEALTQPSSSGATFNGVSSVTYDFGKNIAGLVSLGVGASSSADAFLGVTFTESSIWISSEGCDATGNSGLDVPLWFQVGTGANTYTPDKMYMRGGFRYLTVVSNTTATVPLTSLSINFTAAPLQDLQAYTGWFHSDDELINRIWYSGAYTNQLCTIPPENGDAITSQANGVQWNQWYNNVTIANGSSTITDGAKRDRLVWPGDMAISLESIAVSTGDLYSIQMGLESLYALQLSNGMLPYSGTPFNGAVSYTYHLHNLIGLSFLYRFSGDTNWLSSYWDQYTRGIQWALEADDSTGLANITAPSDWLRFGMGGHVRYARDLSNRLDQSLITSRISKPMRFSTSFFKMPRTSPMS